MKTVVSAQLQYFKGQLAKVAPESAGHDGVSDRTHRSGSESSGFLPGLVEPREVPLWAQFSFEASPNSTLLNLTVAS